MKSTQRIFGVLASSSPFSFFLLSFKELTYFLIVKTDWDHLRPQLLTFKTKLIIDLGKDQNTLYKCIFGTFPAQQSNFRKSYLPHTTSEIRKHVIVGNIFWRTFHPYKELTQSLPDLGIMIIWILPKLIFEIWKFSRFPYFQIWFFLFFLA